MLICLAGLRSIPDYIYEAAEVDRASPLAAVLVDHAADGAALHHAGGAVPRHRELQDVRHGQPADRRRPGLDHRGRLDHAQARSLRELAHRLFLGLRDHPVRHGVRPRQHLREGAEPGEAADERSPRSPFGRRAQRRRRSGSPARSWSSMPLDHHGAADLDRAHLVQDRRPTAIAYPPKILFAPSLEGYCNLFTDALAPDAGISADACRRRSGTCDGDRARRATWWSPDRRTTCRASSIRSIIAFGSTFLAVAARHAVGLRLLALQGAAEGRSAVLHPVDPDDAADRGRDPDLPDVPRARPHATPGSA